MRKKILAYFFLVALNTLILTLLYSLYSLSNYMKTKLEEIQNLKLNYSKQIEKYKEAIKFAKSLGIRVIKKDEAMRIVLNQINSLESIGKVKLLSDLNTNDGKVSVKLELRFSPKSKKEFKNIIKRILESKEPIVVLKDLLIDNSRDVVELVLKIVIIQPYSE